MPFTTAEAKSKTAAIGPVEMGDHCNLAFRPMVDEWVRSARWTTAHELRHEVLERLNVDFSKLDSYEKDKYTALDLAWQVFFNIYVMPYEEMKRNINGNA